MFEILFGQFEFKFYFSDVKELFNDVFNEIDFYFLFIIDYKSVAFQNGGVTYFKAKLILDLCY